MLCSVGIGHAIILTQASDVLPLALGFYVLLIKMDIADFASVVSTFWMSTRNSNNAL